MVDILSDGRMELGLGAGYRVPEWKAFGANGKRRFELLEERAREVRRLWDERVTTPPPIQRRPPIWIGGEGPRGARIAGRLGDGLLALKQELLEPYRESLQKAGHDPQSARMAGCANFILADDPEAVWPRIAPHLAYQWDSYYRYAAEGRRSAQLSLSPVDPDTLRTSGTPILPLFDVVTPTEAIQRLRPWLAPLPVSDVYFWDSIAGMPTDIADRHVELLSTHLVPAFA
jgi:alkanesulfonate monooxygenase SsuD/methylene tetrahydromethanopterin reductase-like flavin-dependent oxidoreductase (luciferase family)